MRKQDLKSSINEGLADLAQRAEHDHEVQMARADLYKIAKYAIKLHEMLKGISEDEGLEGWQQAKITKASDYISAVYHNLDYETKFNGAGELGEGKYKSDKQRKAIHAAKGEKKSKSYKESLAHRLSEEAESELQQKAAGAALSAKRGETPVSKLKGAAKDMYNSMSEKELRDFAKTKHAGLPEKK